MWVESMIWKLRNNNEKNRKKQMTFIPEKIDESTEELLNPARGWYTIYPFQIEKSIDPEELKWYLRKSESIVLVELDLGAYTEKPLDFSALKHIKAILQFFKSYEKDVILRPVYDLEGKGIEHEPKSLDLVLKHLEQIGRLLKETEHSVYLFQGLLIGSWGEMHTSRYTSKNAMRKLYDCMQSYLDEEIYLAVRTPAIWRGFIEKEKYEKNKYFRTGLFHDAMFASSSDMGTYGVMTSEAAKWKQSWTRIEEIQFMSRINEKIPYGGEVLAGEERSIQSMITELKRLHISYLNHAYDKKRLDEWKDELWIEEDEYYGQSCYDYIGAHMGYRFVVSNPRQKAYHRMSKKIEVEFTIENTGFGNCLQETEVVICVENGAERYKDTLEIDLKDCVSGDRKNVTTLLPAMEGNVVLRAFRKKDKREIHFANKTADPLLLGVLQL